MDLDKIARRVAASAGQRIYRVITDEPVGVCVGFAPSQEALDKINAEVDEWPLASDDGSDGTPYLTGNGSDVAILDMEMDDPGVPEGYSPLGMDLSVWRSEADMLDALGDGPSEGSPPEGGMTSVFIGVKFDPGMPSEEAVKQMKLLIEADGYKTGSFETEQEEEGSVVGNLEVSQSFWDDHSEEGWEGSTGSIEASMEVP